MSHSIDFREERCTGCTLCVKSCPTEALRVIRAKASIYDQRCIDCGHCVSVCPHHAFSVHSDSLASMAQFKYNIAIPDTTLYGQFRNLDDVRIVNAALLDLGFDAVYPAALGAEILTRRWKETSDELFGETLPRIPTECPAAIRLICIEFPDLIENVIDGLCSFEVAAMVARKDAAAHTGLDPSEIGIGLISPCPAKNTRVHHPMCREEKILDYALSLNDIYVKLLSPMKRADPEKGPVRCGSVGYSWGRPGGLCDLFFEKNGVAIDTPANVSRILSDMEDNKLEDADLVEVSMCTQSCFGGCLTVENPFTAKLHMKRCVTPLPETDSEYPEWITSCLPWDYELEEIDTDIADSISQALQIEASAERLFKTLPKFDCGNCGAPSCRAFARDVAEGFSDEGDCIFNIIRTMRGGISHEEEDDSLVPPPFRRPLS